MEDDSQLDLDGYMKNLRLGSITLRLGDFSKRGDPLEASRVSKPKSTCRKSEASPFKSLQKKFQQFESQYDTVTQKQSMNREPSVNIKSNINLHYEVNKKGGGKKAYKFNQRRQLNSANRSDDQQNGTTGASRQETKAFLENMMRAVGEQYESLTQRINQFRQKLRYRIEKEYELVKETIIKFISDLFNSSKSAFVLSFENRVTQLNAGFFVIEEQLKQMSDKLKGYVTGLEHPHWSKNIQAIDDVKIKEEVQTLVSRSERIAVKQAVIQLAKSELQVIEKAFRTLLSPKT